MSDNHLDIEKQQNGGVDAIPQHDLRGLLILNMVLLVLLATVTFGGAWAGADANAQDAPQRARGDYTMVGGRVPGMDGSAAVYIVDAINQEMIVVSYNRSTRRLDGIGYRNLGDDAAGASRGRQPSR